MKRLRYALEKEAGLPCGKKTCVWWNDVFEQNCGAATTDDPPSEYCKNYVPEMGGEIYDKMRT